MSDDPTRLHALIAKVLDGALTDEEHTELASLLGESEAARREYFEFMATHAALQEEWGAADASADISPEQLPVPGRLATAHFLEYLASPTPLSMTVAALVMCVLLTAMALVAPPFYRVWTSRDDATDGMSYTTVAQVTGTHEATWGQGERAAYEGARLVAGRRLELASGNAEITTFSGARYILTGPCEIVVSNAARCRLLVGKIAVDVADASEKAEFQVETPLGTVTDLGTQFGVIVHPDGREETHVLEGVVEVAWSTGGSEAIQRVRLVAGQSLTVSRDEPQPMARSASPERFALRLPDELPKPTAHWLFTSNGVRELVSGGQGALGGEAKVEGHTLILAGDDAHAVLPDPAKGPHMGGSYTIAMWIRPQLIRSQNIFIRTDGIGPATSCSHQILMDAEGRLIHYTFDEQARWIVSPSKLAADKWRHVAISAKDRDVMRLFVDGIEVARSKERMQVIWKKGNHFQVGSQARAIPLGDVEVPALKGNVRDVRIYHSALSSATLQKIYRAAVAQRDAATEAIQLNE